MATIIRADGVITNPPPDTPSLPDIETGLYFDFNASDLGLADNAQVTNWVGSGVAPVANRTLNTRNSSSAWVFPRMDLDGGPGGVPTVSFNGTNQRIRTTDADVVAHTGDFTIALVCSGVASSDNSARFWGGPTTSDLRFLPNASGSLWVSYGATLLLNPLPSGHFVVAASISQGRAIAMASNMDVPLVTIGEFSPELAGFGLGGPNSANPTNPLNGTVTRVRAFTRALSESDIRALVYDLRSQYNI